MSDDEILSDEPPDETTELAALAKAITFGAGHGFELLFAGISHDRHRQRLEQSLIYQIAPLKVLRVELAADVSFVLDDLQSRFEEEHPDALSVAGLERSIFAYETPQSAPVLAGLNIGRSSFFTRLPCPLLFWLTPDALVLLSRGAPDFFSIRSGVYPFEERVPGLSSILEELEALKKQSPPPLDRLTTLLGVVHQQDGQQQRLAGQALLLLGDCFLRANSPDLATRAYLSAQVPFLQLRLNSELFHAWLGLGRARHRMGSLASARDTIESALDLAKNEGLREEETLALLALGDVYVEQGEPFKAGDAFERASTLADYMGNRALVAKAREGLERSGRRVGSESWAITRGVPTGSAFPDQGFGMSRAGRALPDQDNKDSLVNAANSDLIDFLIIAPLREEREAVLAHLSNARRLPPDEQDVRLYYEAEVETQPAGGTTGSYNVIVTSPLGMGRVEAATATMAAIQRWQPRYVLLVGIAGGDPDEVALGDVLLAEQFVDYDFAKPTDEDAQPHRERPLADPIHQALHNAVRRFNERTRYQTFRADPRLYGAAQHVEGWEAAVRVERPDAGTPRMHTGVVISGDKMQAATEALGLYKSDWPKLIGVEMEAAGVAAAAWESVSKPGVLMVRGVSDLADARKGSARLNKWRRYACDVAAAFAVSLLRDGPVPLRAAVKGAALTHPAPVAPPIQSPAQPATAPSTQVRGSRYVVGIGMIHGSGNQVQVPMNQGTSAAGQAVEPPPVPTTLGQRPTKASLRQVLRAVLRLDSDLDAFCIDYFPQVMRRFSSGMDTQQKRSLLLEKEDAARIWMYLQEAAPQACAKHAHLIVMEG